MNIMNRKSQIVIFLLLISVSTSAQDAGEILARMDKIAQAPKDKQGKVTIILTDKGGKEKVREAIMLQKGPEKKLYKYTKPESQAGIATLTLPGSVMWLSMPAFEKPRKISILTKDSAFNNTDFSWEDMATTPYSERFVPELVETKAAAYVLKLMPKAAKSNYSKVIATVDKVFGFPYFMEFYDLGGKKFKEATYTWEKIGPYWNPAEVMMTDIEKDHSTKIRISEAKFDQGLSDDLFMVENLKKTAGKDSTGK